MFCKSEMPVSSMEDCSIILYDRNTENTHVLNSTAAIYNFCEPFSKKFFMEGVEEDEKA